MRDFELRFVAAALLICTAAPLAAQTPPAATASTGQLRTAADRLIPLLNGGADYAALFSPEFQAQISESKFRELSAQITAQIGKAKSVASVEARDATAADVVMQFERGTATMKLRLGAGNRIAGLLISGVESADVAALGRLEDVTKALASLPGHTGFTATPLRSNPKPLAALEADRPLALGSAFKLVILAELVREIEAGNRRWTDTVILDGRELPGGGYTAKPKGTAVSLRELAEAMIKVSDNSATDILLTTLGRQRIEAMQTRVGIARPGLNRPFLKTMEAFKLKGVGKGALGRRYLALGVPARRRLLDGEVAATPGSAIGDLFADGKPVMNESIEWFASPNDLVRVMDWLRVHSASGEGREARRILAINPGIPAGVAGKFAYVGYKGGSEPGVINMNLLLQDKHGAWTVISAGWNNPAAPVDDARFIALVTRAAELVAR